jgi:FkbH-like protein/FkbM family methyltransferase
VEVGLESFPYLADHRLRGTVVLPGSAFLEMAMVAAAAAGPPAALEDVRFEQAFLVPARGTRKARIVISPDSACRVIDETGTRYLTARLSRAPVLPPGALVMPEVSSTPGEELYTRLAAAGNEYGPAFRVIEEFWQRGDEVVARLRTPSDAAGYLVHPVMLDAAIHALAALTGTDGRVFVLEGCGRFGRFPAPGPAGWVRARRRPGPTGELTGDVALFDDSGHAVGELAGVRLRFPPVDTPTFAIAATFTAEPLADPLSFWFDRLGLRARTAFAPYGQVFQQLLDPSSLLGANSAGVNIVCVRPQDWQPGASFDPAGLVQLNSYETDHLYEEIVRRRGYLRHGVDLRDGDCVFDVGANIGMFALFVHEQCRNATVYAFEPAPRAFEALRTNVTGTRTRPFDIGLSDRDGVKDFTFYPRSTVFSGFHADPLRDGTAVRTVIENVLRDVPARLVDDLAAGRLDTEVLPRPTRTLSTVVAHEHVERIDLLKVDAEGSELEILAGIDDEHWKIIRQVAAEVHHPPVRDRVTAMLREHGFDVVEEEAAGQLRGTGFATVYAVRPDRRPGGDELARTAGEFLEALERARRRSPVPWIVCVCPSSPGVAAASAERRLIEGLAGSGVLTITPGDLIADHDPRADELGHIPYTERFFAALGTRIVRRYQAACRPPVKVIAVDCDGTLWDGVCAEDGPAGVRVDEPRRRLREFLVRQQESGVLICLCSKNDPGDVLAVFEHRTDLPLTLGQVAALRVNWEEKPVNLASLAEELGVGLDTFVFLDDDPVECARVRASCPEVVVLHLPTAAEIPDFLDHVWVFDRAETTEEDRRRTVLYRDEARRRSFRESVPTLEAFLAGLELRVRIGPWRPVDLPRLAQLTVRTTQFTVSALRRSAEELSGLLESGGLDCLTVRVADRFGDYGLTGMILFEVTGEAVRVDTFLLSCRALGRGVEHRMTAALGELARERGRERLVIPFRDTGRNEPAVRFFADLAAPGDGRFVVSAARAAAVRFDATTPAAVRPVRRAVERDRIEPSLYGRIADELRDLDVVTTAIAAHRVRSRPALSTGFVAPDDDLERRLAALWQRVLGVEEVGVDDNFFELGGTSLRAVEVAAGLPDAVGAELPLVSLFEQPTIRSIARRLRGGDAWQARSASTRRRGERRRRWQWARRSR